MCSAQVCVPTVARFANCFALCISVLLFLPLVSPQAPSAGFMLDRANESLTVRLSDVCTAKLITPGQGWHGKVTRAVTLHLASGFIPRFRFLERGPKLHPHNAQTWTAQSLPRNATNTHQYITRLDLLAQPQEALCCARPNSNRTQINDHQHPRKLPLSSQPHPQPIQPYPSQANGPRDNKNKATSRSQ